MIFARACEPPLRSTAVTSMFPCFAASSRVTVALTSKLGRIGPTAVVSLAL